MPVIIKKISNTELLEILENPANYQKDAVTAAKAELESRQLSCEAIDAAKEPLLAKQLQRAKKQERTRAAEEQLRNAGNTLADTLRPGQNANEGIDKTILRITAGYSIMIILQFIFSFNQFRGLSLKDISYSPLAVLVSLLSFIVGPAGVVSFFKRKPTGWMLLILFTIICFEQTGELLFFAARWQLRGNNAAFYRVFSPPSPFKYVLPLLIYGSAIYLLCDENIRGVFNINSKKMKNTLGVCAGLILLLIIAA